MSEYDCTCDACGAAVLDIDVKCGTCGHRLTSTGAHRMLGATVLGQYEIIDILGQGGMSVVYKARHKITEQEVALKILPPELAAHSQVKSRFLEEAKALAQLDHPNIVHLYNFGEENGVFVLAMQFVAGTTWERMILEAEQLHWGLATGICIDVLRALEYAHNRGIVHRDMKPSNVLVREDDGSATVMDFGIAKMHSSSKLTATGQTMGTVRYMSPEQVRGLSVDLRTDIYSLGATLYEALVGDTPFDGDTHFEIMTQHLNEPPVPPSSHGIEVPGSIERAVMRALAKRPEDRFQSAGAFREALEKGLAAGHLGEAETLRMSRDFVKGMPKTKTGQAAAGGLASTLEPTGDDSAAEPPIPAGRRRAGLWIGLALVLLAATAGVAGVLVYGRSRRGTAAAAAADAGPPPFPAAFRVSGLTYAAEQMFPDDGLRVLSVAPRDPAQVRGAYLDAVKRFAAFVRDRGYQEARPPSPITLEIVPREVLCRPEIYTRSQPSGDCRDRDGWYRIHEKTLLLAAEGDLNHALAVNVARVMCLINRMGACGDVVNAFEKSI